MKTNYVIGAWGGPRSDFEDGNLFIKTHIEKLQSTKHNLSLVTIGYPFSSDELPEYTAFMKKLEKDKFLSDGTPVVIFRTDNNCLSYGQWSKIFDHYRSQFDYYIFVEDDYLPAIDDFDEILRKLHTKGYLCSLIFDQKGKYAEPTIQHGAISNGIIDSECLEAIHRKFGKIPCEHRDPWQNQIIFTRAPLDVKYPLSEYIASKEYRAIYWNHYEFIVYGNIEGKDLFVPIQYWESPKKFLYRHIDKNYSSETCYEKVANISQKIM